MRSPYVQTRNGKAVTQAFEDLASLNFSLSATSGGAAMVGNPGHTYQLRVAGVCSPTSSDRTEASHRSQSCRMPSLAASGH